MIKNLRSYIKRSFINHLYVYATVDVNMFQMSTSTVAYVILMQASFKNKQSVKLDTNLGIQLCTKRLF